jgi:hypothetical protein
MKKCKRMLSVLLAAIMVLGMLSISALAVDPDPTEGQNQGNSEPAGGTGDQGNNGSEANKKGPAENPITQLPASKTVSLAKDSVIPDGTKFTIQMVPATADELKDENGKAKEAGGQVVQAGVALPTVTPESGDAVDYSKVVYEFGSDDTLTTEGNTSTVTKSDKYFDLSQIPFTNTGVYRYYVSEDTTGAKSYIDYSSDKYEVDLYVFKYTKTVTNDDNEETTEDYLGVGYCIVKKMEKQENGTYEYTGAKPETCGFTNTVKVANAKIGKQVNGEAYTVNEDFTFYIRIPAGGVSLNLTTEDSIKAQIVHTDGSDPTPVTIAVKRDLKADEDLDKVFTDSEISQEFTLKDGEYLELLGAPQGMIYFVQEKDYHSEGYTQTYTYTESGNVTTSDTLGNVTSVANPSHAAVTKTVTTDNEDNEVAVYTVNTAKGTVNSEDSTMTFINTRVINPDTGVNLDLIPYVVILLAAAAFGAVLIIRKKRNVQ